MLCDVCGKNQATVHLTEIIDEQMNELHLCEECARHKSAAMEQQFGLSELLAGMADFEKPNKDEEVVTAKCPSCGLTYADFKKLGRLGCGECYNTFRQYLAPLLKRIHGSNQHVGKSPLKTKAKPQGQVPITKKVTDLQELKVKLQKAIEKEIFEEAALLRDQIKEIEKEAGYKIIMQINDLLNHTSEWLKGTGPNSDIVISSRIRLARNLSKFPFPHWASKAQLDEVLTKTSSAMANIDLLKSSTFFRLADLDVIDKQFLVERHLMSIEHSQKTEQKAVLVDDEEIIAVMVNEEDHLRIQLMQSGFNLFEARDIINRIDDALAKELDYAYLEDFGYLTACPTNTGTGMRGSVMLHLPALVMSRQIERVLAAISKLSFTTRGLYGEGTQASGNFFQISNQVSLGHAEDEIIENINGLIRQIIEQETQAREILLSKSREVLEDRINRSLGILKSARIITSQETIELLSMVRLGCDLGMIKDIDRRTINELFIITQPAHLQKLENKKLTSAERDLKRAQLIRKKLNLL